MVDVRQIIKLAMESLPMSDLNEENYHSFLHEIKDLAIDMQNIKEKLEELTSHERITRLEEKVNILMSENLKLKLILEDLCYEASRQYINKPNTRRKS